VLQIAQEYPNSSVKVFPPQGAFYFYLDMRSLGLPTDEMCEGLLQEAGVGLIPERLSGHRGKVSCA
jgi:aspartate/methionine/tyrosine aminotransferase